MTVLQKRHFALTYTVLKQNEKHFIGNKTLKLTVIKSVRNPAE
jgi:hypothetical protein